MLIATIVHWTWKQRSCLFMCTEKRDMIGLSSYHYSEEEVCTVSKQVKHTLLKFSAIAIGSFILSNKTDCRLLNGYFHFGKHGSQPINLFLLVNLYFVKPFITIYFKLI